jgi:hypothetical protein
MVDELAKQFPMATAAMIDDAIGEAIKESRRKADCFMAEAAELDEIVRRRHAAANDN